MAILAFDARVAVVSADRLWNRSRSPAADDISTIDSATCSATVTRRPSPYDAQVRFGTRLRDCRTASTLGTRAVATTLTSSSAATAAITRTSTRGSKSYGTAVETPAAPNRCTNHVAITSPPAVPAPAHTSVSSINCRTTAAVVAPSAIRTTSSCRRVGSHASSRPATLIHATVNSTSTAPPSTVSVFVESPSSKSRIGRARAVHSFVVSG